MSVLKTAHLPRTKVAILAGGQGSRLKELTKFRAKPALPIFAKYLIIDGVLANAFNSGFHNMGIITQYMADSVTDHIQSHWGHRTAWGNRILTHSPKGRTPKELKFAGTANAIYQNWYELTKRGNPELMLILSGDHVHKMDYSQMVEYHVLKDSEFTICANTVTIEEAAGAFGVIQVDEDNRVIGFEEKPANPAPLPDKPGYCLASMGNYLMPVEGGWDMLEKEEAIPREKGEHDFGKHIIPDIIKTHKVFAYRFKENVIQGKERQERHVWRDVGSIPAYLDVHRDVCSEDPDFSLYSEKTWPVPSGSGDATAPHKEVDDCSIFAGGSIVHKGGTVYYSSLHKNAEVFGGAEVLHSVIMDETWVGANSRLRYVIADKRRRIPEGTVIGYDREHDNARGFRTVDYHADSWITLVPLDYEFS